MSRQRESPSEVRDWRAVYASRLLLTDFVVLVWVVFGVQIAWFGFTTADVQFRGNAVDVAISYSVVSVVIVTAWMLALWIYGARGHRVVGTGSAEYRLIADGSIRLFGLVAIIAFLLQIDLARGYILIAFPLGMVVLIFSRWMWRQWLSAKRATGEFSATVLLIGSVSSVVRLSGELARQPEAGYRVIGACVPDHSEASFIAGTRIRTFGDVDSLPRALALSGADTVIVTSSEDLPPERIRQLSWSLEPGRQHLVVAPGLADIGGPRIHMRPVAGLPLIHVEMPRYDGLKRFAKRAFDLVGSAAIIVVASPFLLVIAVAIRLSGPGSVFFGQNRIGLGGRSFRMLKFRSMVSDAETQLDGLLDSQRAEGNSVMFKMKDDPRVTPIGRFIRRYSLDELPQLFNVFAGRMSIVGPRPPLESEVAAYENHVHRRFLVKPGITGLWQVSGRSNLSWEDTVRLDLYYVENWSMTGDLAILWRTGRAVLGGDGAY